MTSRLLFRAISAGLLFLAIISAADLRAGQILAPSVVINEIHHDEDDKTQRAEFIELFNPSENPVDLGGFYFSSGIDFTFPAGSSLPVGGYVVVAEDPATMVSKFGYDGAFGPFENGTQLKNTGETITLRDPGGKKVDEVDYALGWPWPTVGDDVGSPAHSPSIELINPLLDNNLAGSWRASGFPVASAIGGGGPVAFVSSGDVWEYLDDGSDQGATGWKTDAGNTAGWSAGPSQLGYNEGDEATLVGDGDGDPRSAPRAITTYFRRAVEIVGLPAFSTMKVRLLRDDGAVVYVNGTEAFRDSIDAGPFDFQTPANDSKSSAREDEFVDYNLSPGLFVEGVNVIAVEIHQFNTSNSDISFDLELIGEATASSASNNSPTPGAANRSSSANAPPQLRQVGHDPVGRVLGEDKTILPGEDVVVMVKATDPDGIAAVTLEYQLVNPGSYIKEDDADYQTDWTSIPMTDDGSGGDTFTATVPAALNTHRRLVRYRIVATDGLGLSIRAPYIDDLSRNFAYFVYGGAPDWQGSARPGGAPAVTYDFSQMEPLPVYHLITTRDEHEESQHIPNATSGGYGGSDYLWNGTLVYDGKVYDHIHFRARGGVWRYSMGKNMWKFDFNRGRRFEARDDYGEKYATSWDKLNFSAIIQQGDYQHRGEQGLFESVGFKLFDLSGVEACKTHFVHFRIIEHASETGPGNSQYDDDFQGMYLAVEQMDSQYLDEHGMPDGNLYKMEGGSGTLNNQGSDQPSDRSDLNSFLSTYNGQNEQWWRDNFDLERYYGYRAIVEGIHHYDIAGGKNYFYYHNPVTDKWQVHPWDLDLTWANNMYGSGDEPFRSRVLGISNLNREYRNKVRELRDLLFNAEQTGLLIDQKVGQIHTPGQASFVDADRAMWDYNPIMSSGLVNGSKSGTGRFYGASVNNPRDFHGMAQKMKNYVTERSNWFDNNILTDKAQIPNKPTLTFSGTSGFPVNGLSFTSSPYSSPTGSGFAGMKWRVAEITPPAELTSLAPPEFEIESDWELGSAAFTASADVDADATRPGRTYRARVKHLDASGRWSHWSDPVEFVASAPDVSQFINDLRVTEINYHPAAATAAEEALGYFTSSFEFVELMNIGRNTLDLTDVRFTKGIDYDLQPGTSIAPGAYALVVRNIAAFEHRYGTGLPVIGEWGDSDSLDNAGENLKLSLGAGIAIIEFTYDDQSPWPTGPDGQGYTLTLDRPELTAPGDHALASSWRASRLIGGTPGADDHLDFATWKSTAGLPAGALTTDDNDGDTIVNLLEYALGGDPTAASLSALPSGGAVPVEVGGVIDNYLTLNFRRQVGASDLTYLVQFSADLANWESGIAVLVVSINNGDGTVTETWRAPLPAGTSGRSFVRLRVEG